MTSMNDKKSILEDYKKYFSVSKLNYLKSLGHNFLENSREGAYITDTENKKYLDCNSSAGIFNLGRMQKDLITELKMAASETDQGNFPMISIEKGNLAQRLAEFVPGNFECSVFSVIRGESIDFACKLARGYTKRKELITFDGAWFGQTGFAFSLSDRKDKSDFGSLIPEVKTLKYNSIEEIEKHITKKTAGVFIELVQSENGCRVADQEFIIKLRKICSKTGALLIIDETQTGLGRTGKKFAYEHYGITPDILVIGESLGGGIFPIAATVFSQKLNKFMNAHPMIHLSTFGGSDIGCRVGLKALNIYDEAAPWKNAENLGIKLSEKLNSIGQKYPDKIKKFSGRGLLFGLTLADEAMAVSLCRESSAKGILISLCEVAQASIVIRPCLTLKEEDVEFMAKGLTEAFQKI